MCVWKGNKGKNVGRRREKYFLAPLLIFPSPFFPDTSMRRMKEEKRQSERCGLRNAAAESGICLLTV